MCAVLGGFAHGVAHTDGYIWPAMYMSDTDMSQSETERDGGDDSENLPWGLKRADDGAFETDTRARILEALPGDCEPVIASEVAEEVGVSKSSANYHLNTLADAGAVSKKKFHEKRVVWYLTPEQRSAR